MYVIKHGRMYPPHADMEGFLDMEVRQMPLEEPDINIAVAWNKWAVAVANGLRFEATSRKGMGCHALVSTTQDGKMFLTLPSRVVHRLDDASPLSFLIAVVISVGAGCAQHCAATQICHSLNLSGALGSWKPQSCNHMTAPTMRLHLHTNVHMMGVKSCTQTPFRLWSRAEPAAVS